MCKYIIYMIKKENIYIYTHTMDGKDCVRVLHALTSTGGGGAQLDEEALQALGAHLARLE